MQQKNLNTETGSCNLRLFVSDTVCVGTPSARDRKPVPAFKFLDRLFFYEEAMWAMARANAPNELVAVSYCFGGF